MSQVLRLPEKVTRDAVFEWLSRGQEVLAAADLEVDLGGLAEIDSTAISMLLEWVRLAKARGRKVRYLNIPPNLSSLASLYGVRELIEHP